MTQQYQQRNINQQGDSVAFAATVATPAVALQPSVQMVQVDATLANATATLPLATDAGQNASITVVKSDAGANTVTVAVLAGDALVAGAAIVNPIAAQWQSLTMSADPDNNRWVVTGFTL